MLIFVIVCVFLVHPTFASETLSSCAEQNVINNRIVEVLRLVWRLTSWIWIILWSIDGVLMSNSLVYWEFMWFDVYLWKIWQICRNFANFTIWFIFLYSILRYIFDFSNQVKVKETLKQILFASVLVQASWFLVMAVIDLSTIALATVTAFPSQVIASSTKVETYLHQQIQSDSILKEDCVVINAFSDSYLNWSNEHWYEKCELWWTAATPADKQKTLIDNLVPKADNLKWPFLMLWFTALNAQEFVWNYDETNADSCPDLFTKVIISLLLDAWITILFSFALLVLGIILVFRLFYLRIFIALSPIIILVSVVKDLWLSNNKELWIKKTLKLIFQPVIFWIFMSLMFLFVVVTHWFFNSQWWNFSWWWVTVKSTPSAPFSSELSLGDSVKLFVKQWSKRLTDIALALFSLFFMWYLVKLALLQWETWISKVDSFVKGITDTVWRTMWNAGVIPTPKWAIWFNQLKRVPDTWVSQYTTDLTANTTKAKRKLSAMFWLNNSIDDLNDNQKVDLNNLVNQSKTWQDLLDTLDVIRSENGWLKFTQIRPYISKFIARLPKTDSTFRNIFRDQWDFVRDDVFAKYNDEKPEEAYTTLISNKQAFKAFYTSILWWKADKVPTTYKELLKPEYSNI